MQLSANLIKRTISTLILAPIMFSIIWIGGALFSSVILGLCALMMIEIVNISFNLNTRFSKMRSLILSAIATSYVVVACSCIISIRELDYMGKELTLWLFLTVWSVDIGAYIFGKLIKGPKIMPSISPNKTYSGLICGCLLAAFTSSIFTLIIPIITWQYVILSIFTGIVAQIGDFLESYFKRITKVKDTGNIIPGHGGILDRMDGMLMAAIFICFILQLTNFT